MHDDLHAPTEERCANKRCRGRPGRFARPILSVCSLGLERSRGREVERLKAQGQRLILRVQASPVRKKSDRYRCCHHCCCFAAIRAVPSEPKCQFFSFHLPYFFLVLWTVPDRFNFPTPDAVAVAHAAPRHEYMTSSWKNSQRKKREQIWSPRIPVRAREHHALRKSKKISPPRKDPLAFTLPNAVTEKPCPGRTP